MENQKQKKSVGTIALVVLLLIVTIASLVLATYAWAKYTSKTSDNATAEVAKWDVTFDQDKSKMFATFQHVTPSRIAPGTNGSFDIEVKPNDTEVCFDYTINIDSLEFVGSDGKTAIADTTVLEKAYNANLAETAEAADKAANELARIDGITEDVKLSDLKNHILVSSDGTTYKPLGTNLNMTGAYHINDCADKNNTTDLKRTIYWKWDFEGTGTDTEKARYDQIDTAAGRYANDNVLKLKFQYTITATQVKPVK